MDQNEAMPQYQALVAAVKAAVDTADPIGLLRFGAPSDEYDPEVVTIVPRVVKAEDISHVRRIVHEEFGRCFGVDTAGPIERYETPAREIWRAVLSFRGAV